MAIARHDELPDAAILLHGGVRPIEQVSATAVRAFTAALDLQAGEFLP